jgi:hypothetical protein
MWVVYHCATCHDQTLSFCCRNWTQTLDLGMMRRVIYHSTTCHDKTCLICLLKCYKIEWRLDKQFMNVTTNFFSKAHLHWRSMLGLNRNAILPPPTCLGMRHKWRHDIQLNDTQQNTQHNDIQQNDTQHNDILHYIKLNTTLSIMVLCCYAECRKQAITQCHYAKFHYAECCYAECRGATQIGSVLICVVLPKVAKASIVVTVACRSCQHFLIDFWIHHLLLNWTAEFPQNG